MWSQILGKISVLVHEISLKKKSLLRRMQAQTLPDATSQKGKIHPFSKMAVTFEPMMRF